MSKSPVPKKKQPATMTFSEAVEQVLMGNSITKLEWADKEYHVLLDAERLRLHKPDGKYYDWIISEADARGDDYVFV